MLETVYAYIILKCCKNSRELPDDGVDKSREASELKRDQLTKKCVLIVGLKKATLPAVCKIPCFLFIPGFLLGFQLRVSTSFYSLRTSDTAR